MLPAGTVYKRVLGSSDLLIVGAYAEGQERFDMVRDGGGDAEGVTVKIAAVALSAMVDPQSARRYQYGKFSDDYDRVKKAMPSLAKACKLKALAGERTGCTRTSGPRCPRERRAGARRVY